MVQEISPNVNIVELRNRMNSFMFGPRLSKEATYADEVLNGRVHKLTDAGGEIKYKDAGFSLVLAYVPSRERGGEELPTARIYDKGFFGPQLVAEINIDGVKLYDAAKREKLVNFLLQAQHIDTSMIADVKRQWTAKGDIKHHASVGYMEKADYSPNLPDRFASDVEKLLDIADQATIDVPKNIQAITALNPLFGHTGRSGTYELRSYLKKELREKLDEHVKEFAKRAGMLPSSEKITVVEKANIDDWLQRMADFSKTNPDGFDYLARAMTSTGESMLSLYLSSPYGIGLDDVKSDIEKVLAEEKLSFRFDDAAGKLVYTGDAKQKAGYAPLHDFLALQETLERKAPMAAHALEQNSFGHFGYGVEEVDRAEEKLISDRAFFTMIGYLNDEGRITKKGKGASKDKQQIGEVLEELQRPEMSKWAKIGLVAALGGTVATAACVHDKAPSLLGCFAKSGEMYKASSLMRSGCYQDSPQKAFDSSASLQKTIRDRITGYIPGADLVKLFDVADKFDLAQNAGFVDNLLNTAGFECAPKKRTLSNGKSADLWEGLQFLGEIQEKGQTPLQGDVDGVMAMAECYDERVRALPSPPSGSSTEKLTEGLKENINMVKTLLKNTVAQTTVSTPLTQGAAPPGSGGAPAGPGAGTSAATGGEFGVGQSKIVIDGLGDDWASIPPVPLLGSIRQGQVEALKQIKIAHYGDGVYVLLEPTNLVYNMRILSEAGCYISSTPDEFRPVLTKEFWAVGEKFIEYRATTSYDVLKACGEWEIIDGRRFFIP